MLHIDIKVLEKSAYKEFVNQQLKENIYIIISVLENYVPVSFGKSIPLPEKIDYHNIYISENEQLYCYENKYYDSYSTLNQYNSLEEFFDFTNIYRMMFATSDKVTVECMCDEIIVY